MEKEKFYITTTLPYVNAPPHIGFALELVQADIIARYQRDILGKEVVFNTGTDEHGLKIYRNALEAGKDPQAYVDEYAAKFERLKEGLNVDYTNFIRTTDPHHIEAAQEFWRICDRNGFIYKRAYQTKYCVGCELEKTDSELVDGKCPLHPNLKIELIEEENYFFKFSQCQQPLLELYEKYPDFVIPSSRLNEIRTFVEGGLQDFSISRLKEKMPWGVPVPGDEAQVMYVWFDALVNYISTLGWPTDMKRFEDFWGTKESPRGVQIAGKDNLRQQSAIWQGMLLAAGLPPSRHILIHGFITSNGQKMSKSLGNVVDPFEVVEKYGTEAFRYWCAREMPTYEDGDFTWEKFKESYNAYLANGLGNIASRLLKMGMLYDVRVSEGINSEHPPFSQAMEAFEIRKAADYIWTRLDSLDKQIQAKEPFKKIKTNPEEAKEGIKVFLGELQAIAGWLTPFLPETSNKIRQALREHSELSPLFPRIQ